MKKREFLKKSVILASSTAVLPSIVFSCKNKTEAVRPNATNTRLRTAHIGVGNMGAEDLRDIASHDLEDQYIPI